MFGYLRLFAIFSLLAMILIAVAAGASFRSLAVADLTQMVEKHNKSLAQGYITGVWARYSSIILPLAEGDGSGLRGNPKVMEFAQETVRYFQHMPLQRVNIYTASGLLLMTANGDVPNKITIPSASPDSAFVTAQLRKAIIVSQVVESVPLQNATMGTLTQTLVPIRFDGNNFASDGALEMLYDTTGPAQRMKDFQIYGTGGVIAVFLIFLSLLIMTSRRAENIIAKQHEANIELAATAATAQAESQEKSQFLANISHELRTPLNAIIGFSDIIKTEVIASLQNKKYHDYINDIHSSGVHLLSLINDILDYSKAEAGKLEMEVTEINATKLVQNCMRLIGPRAETANVALTESLPKEALIMITDSKKFKQIFLNLLSNAVKFTPAGGQVRVSAWHNISEESYGFEVRDTGIGIAPKDISRAMAPFGQVDSALSRKYEGTGLGLPLTKKFIEIMGGKFTIESEVGVGTTISFTLPRELKEREGVILKQAS